jgi:hypothetical protein
MSPSFDRKRIENSSHRGINAFDSLHPAQGRSLFHFLKQFSDRLGFSLDKDLNTGVRAVAHIAAQAQFSRRVLHKIPEPYALHPAVDRDLFCLHRIPAYTSFLFRLPCQLNSSRLHLKRRMIQLADWKPERQYTTAKTFSHDESTQPETINAGIPGGIGATRITKRNGLQERAVLKHCMSPGRFLLWNHRR